MNYLFPFSLVPQGSRLILFGTGDVGKDFYLQLREIGDYYALLAWTATTLDAWEVRPPFVYARNIQNYDFDFIIVATINENFGREIIEYCLTAGVPSNKLIWSPVHYLRNRDYFSSNHEMMLKHLDYYMDIMEERCQSMSPFGNKLTYQSFLKLGLSGQRNNENRLEVYQIPVRLSKNDTVLDIGCNCGFFTLQVAPYVGFITGIDVDEHLINIGERTKILLGIENARFEVRDLWQSDVMERRYSVIFALAIYRWIIESGISKDRFVNKIWDGLMVGGYCFLESHNVKEESEETRFQEIGQRFLDRGMKLVERIRYPEKDFHREFERELWILQKC